jgi:DNA-binding XRE family transcriptional regulator
MTTSLSVSGLGIRIANRADTRATRALEVSVEQRSRHLLVPRHEMSVTVIRDRHRRMPHVRAKSLCIHTGRDHQRGECVPPLVERDRLQLRALGNRRREKKLTQRELAYFAGCSRTTVSMLESGKLEVSVALKARIAHALGIDVAELWPPADVGNARAAE